MQELGSCKDDAEGIQRFNELVFGSRLHPGQLDVSLNARKQTNLISPGNSFGKTEWIERDAVWRHWKKHVQGTAYRDARQWLTTDYRGLVCSYQFDIAKESYQRIEHRYDQGGALTALISRIIRSDPPMVEFTNGARLDFGSLDQGGRHVEATRRQVVYVDEVGHMPEFRDTYRGVLYPRTIGVNGIVFLFGTPKPNTDPWLYEVALEAMENPDGYYYFREGSSFENTFWPPEERNRVLSNPELVHQGILEKMRLAGADIYDGDALQRYGALTEMGLQVILGKFILAGGLFFNRAHVLRMFRGNHEFYDAPKHCVTAWDTAGSNKNSDATVGITLDISTEPWQVSRFVYLPGGSADWSEKYDIIEDVQRRDQAEIVAVDVTGASSDAVAEELENRGLPIERVHFGGTTSKKYDMLRNLQSRMETECPVNESPELPWSGKMTKGWIRWPNIVDHPELEPARREFDFYRLDDTKLTQDCVMCLAMVVKLASEFQSPPVYSGYSY